MLLQLFPEQLTELHPVLEFLTGQCGLQRLLAALPENLLGLRDRALLLIGFAGAFGRSELVALNAEDVQETADGLVVTLRRGKTDPEAIAGKSERAIMNQTGHRSLPTVRRYIRDANLFRENAADGIGL